MKFTHASHKKRFLLTPPPPPKQPCVRPYQPWVGLLQDDPLPGQLLQPLRRHLLRAAMVRVRMFWSDPDPVFKTWSDPVSKTRSDPFSKHGRIRMFVAIFTIFCPFFCFLGRMQLLGDPKVTANLYCNFAYQYLEGCVICSMYMR